MWLTHDVNYGTLPNWLPLPGLLLLLELSVLFGNLGGRGKMQDFLAGGESMETEVLESGPMKQGYFS